MSWLLISSGFASVFSLHLAGHTIQIYTGLAALLVNLLLVAILTPCFRIFGISEKPDATTPEDYEARRKQLPDLSKEGPQLVGMR